MNTCFDDTLKFKSFNLCSHSIPLNDNCCN